ncbi:hypothetical protein POM88_021842 [Heracleum sosnowskyi]|uniref:F-box domain-containing protein n=1 Tax=Heracleum sosnowskyi TaxID=360622 RepID=A0AAD8MT64_9APIA|nr:hypothetical protein POM88_021842 [Heracleum sosnowskyi]
MFSVYSRYLEQKKLGRAEDVERCRKVKIFGAEIQVNWSLWSQPEEDLLRDMMSRLSFADHVRFGAVCKSWHDVDEYEKAPSYSLPWLISIEEFWNNMLECQLYKPSNPSPVAVDKINLHESGTIPYTLWSADTICKYGWLFFSIERQFENRASFLLFSPFFPQSINSPHCVFLVLDNYASFGSITIRTCCRGDEEWTRRVFGLNAYTSFSSTPV